MTTTRSTLIPWIAVVWTLGSWACCWVVDKSCEFVYSTGRFVLMDNDNGNGNELLPSQYHIYRGIQQGQAFSPDDSCRSWRDQVNDDNNNDSLDLDSKMIAARVSAALSVVLGFFVWFYITLFALRGSQCILAGKSSTKTCFMTSCLTQTTSSRTVQYSVMFLALCVAVFQALTHLMVKSNLCEQAEPFVAMLDDGRQAIYDECQKDTPVYTLTFGTMALWIGAAILIGCSKLPTSKDDEQQQAANEDDDTGNNSKSNNNSDAASTVKQEDADPSTTKEEEEVISSSPSPPRDGNV